MKFGPGQEYDILSIEAFKVISTLPAYSRHKQEVSRFLTHELHNYLGQRILYGTVLQHDFRVARGVQEVKTRPSCFVVLMKETGGNIERLVKILKGDPLGIRQGGQLVPIINWSSELPGISDGRTKDKDKLIDRAIKVINLYRYWKEHDARPPWFLEAQRKAEEERVSKGGNGQKPRSKLWTPGDKML